MLDIQISAPGCGNTRLLSNDGKVFLLFQSHLQFIR
ncbi:hypothetical protein VCSRO76_0638 [Vibrio cholerae]|nr:hypothetical protein DN35_665 [Vibrio cholerae]GHY76805.1 hypothetical protein VCSRO26_0351 [Vibrio cholerae]GHY97995.1 hypothetical protein VCSRO76_0638 [Vibrio cholerae]